VPRVPNEFDWDLNAPGSRFSPRPAIAFGIPEEAWARDIRPGQYEAAATSAAEEAFRREIGDWALDDEQEEIGRPQALSGSTGRGAAGLAAVLEFVAIKAAGGVIATAAGMAFKTFLARVKRERRHDNERAIGLNVSRGGAAYLAIAEVAEHHEPSEWFEVEAVEEPSSIAGANASELSYVGLEPWIVLLRNPERTYRYIVVVASNGEVEGVSKSAISEWERLLFLPPPEESTWARASQPVRRRKRR